MRLGRITAGFEGSGGMARKDSVAIWSNLPQADENQAQPR